MICFIFSKHLSFWKVNSLPWLKCSPQKEQFVIAEGFQRIIAYYWANYSDQFPPSSHPKWWQMDQGSVPKMQPQFRSTNYGFNLPRYYTMILATIGSLCCPSHFCSPRIFFCPKIGPAEIPCQAEGIFLREHVERLEVLVVQQKGEACDHSKVSRCWTKTWADRMKKKQKKIFRRKKQKSHGRTWREE